MNERVLASRFLRLVASVLDWILTIMVTIMVLGTTRFLEHPNAFDSSWTVLSRVVGAGVIAYLLLHGWLLVSRGQSFGKFLCGLKIVKRGTDERPSIGVLVLRSLIFGFSYSIFQYGLVIVIYIADSVSIFFKSRRCLHDMLLLTEVIKYQPATDKEDDELEHVQQASTEPSVLD